MLFVPLLASAVPFLCLFTGDVRAAETGSADGQTFDYVIVGGGLSGLVVANRLSESKSCK